VTRPSGTSPRGLPFPGSAGIHANTPAAIQALAEAVEAQLSSLGSGVILDTFTGKVRLGPGVGYGASTFYVPFPRLATVLGALASYGTFLGGPAVPLVIGAAPGAPNWTNPYIDPLYFTAWPINNNVFVTTSPGQGYFPEVVNTDITVCALGWGIPK